MQAYKDILVMGAGAVGGYFGGLLAARTSSEVSMIVRGEHLEAIQQNGLSIRSVEGDILIDAKALNDPGAAGTPDLILFTVKSYDTDMAIRKISPVVADHTQILSLQNGVENYHKLVEAFGQDRIIWGFCKIGVGVVAPGVIEHRAFGMITAGEPDGTISPRIKRLRELFSSADIPFHISPDICHEVWKKFAWNTVLNMLTALANVTVEKLFELEASEQLCHKLFEEIRQVAAAREVTLSDEDEQAVLEGARHLEGFETSTYQDRQKGKRMEYEAFTGAVVRLAEQHGIPVPRHQTLYALFKLMDNYK